MSYDQITQLLASVLPTVILIFGGQFIFNRYAILQKSKEQELELIRYIREKQYTAIESLYDLFAEFMSLYRLINDINTNLQKRETHEKLLNRIIEAESKIDALILRIGCEFFRGTENELESLLGHMRQSVQQWRESIQQRKKLPFSHSEQNDYMRFKESFAGVAAFMTNQIQSRLEPPKMRLQDTKSLLRGAFSNKYEYISYEPDE